MVASQVNKFHLGSWFFIIYSIQTFLFFIFVLFFQSSYWQKLLDQVSLGEYSCVEVFCKILQGKFLKVLRITSCSPTKLTWCKSLYLNIKKIWSLILNPNFLSFLSRMIINIFYFLRNFFFSLASKIIESWNDVV